MIVTSRKWELKKCCQAVARVMLPRDGVPLPNLVVVHLFDDPASGTASKTPPPRKAVPK